MTPAGFPHSDISGSTPACDSPKLFAANHVLHRLLTPRHSPCARSSLVTNLLRRGDPCGFTLQHNIGASLLSLSRYAVYKVECSKNIRSPLTLDCVVRSSCASNDVLKTRFRVVVFYLIVREPISATTRGERRETYSISRHPSSVVCSSSY